MIALIDNMNNNFFSLCRYLRDFGMDAHLFMIPSQFAHFHPQADTYQDVNTMDYVHEFPADTNDLGRFITDFNYDFSDLKKCEVVICCGQSPAFLYRSGIDIDLFVSYGYDLCNSPFLCSSLFTAIYRNEGSIRSIWAYLKNKSPITNSELNRYYFSLCQRRALRKARVVISNDKYTPFKEALDRLGIKGYVNSGIPMVYNQASQNGTPEMWDFMGEHDFVVFSHSRQLWKTNPHGLHDFLQHGGNNRNDRVIRAFASFLRITEYQTPVLVLFEYGPDVDESKQLVHELGIDGYVKWMPKCDRREIMEGIAGASIVAAEFREGLCGIGGTSYEAMASGVPLITHTNGAIGEAGNVYYKAPILDALTEEDIVNALIDYERCPEKYAYIGVSSKRWFADNLGVGLARKYANLIEILAKDRKVTQKANGIRRIFRD